MWPEHWHAVQVFLAMTTQWRVVSTRAGLLRLGLDYAALEPVLQEHRRGLHRQPMSRLMAQLRALEGTALELINR